MNIFNLYDHDDIKMNDKKESTNNFRAIGGRDTFQDSSVSCRINFRMH